MVIKCDFCDADVTPNDDCDFDNQVDNHYEILKVNGSESHCCIDCWIAIGHWATSNEAKQYCKKHAKKAEQ